MALALLTGFPGFIGKRLVAKLLADDPSWRVVALVEPRMVDAAREAAARDRRGADRGRRRATSRERAAGAGRRRPTIAWLAR